MQIPRVIRWGFNPDKSELEALREPASRVLWAVLRHGHIVDQHFNQEVADLAVSLRARPVADGASLYYRACDFGLCGFGMERAGGTLPPLRSSRFDSQWWGELLLAWRGDIVIEHIITADMRTSDGVEVQPCS